MNRIRIYYLLSAVVGENEDRIRQTLAEKEISAAQRHKIRGNMLLALGSAYLKKRFVGDGIKISPLGKPYAGGVFFSVSHCEGMVGIALSEENEVGLDIESNAAACEETACYCCTEDEINSGVPPLELFTAKESLGKAEGGGLRVGPKKIPALPPEGRLEYRNGVYYRHAFRIPPYSVSVTQRESDFYVEEEYINEL